MGIRDDLFEMGSKLVHELNQANGIPAVRIHAVGSGRNYGWYDHGDIYVNLPRTRPPTSVPGFSWTYPGYKADLTAYGVIAHENGHHVYASIYSRIDKRKWRLVLAEEAAVTSYEPNMSEAFAEAMKVFSTNPDLLAQGRPLRYLFLTGELGLEPVIKEDWRDVLSEAHEKFIHAAEAWIGKGING